MKVENGGTYPLLLVWEKVEQQGRPDQPEEWVRVSQPGRGVPRAEWVSAKMLDNNFIVCCLDQRYLILNWGLPKGYLLAGLLRGMFFSATSKPNLVCGQEVYFCIYSESECVCVCVYSSVSACLWLWMSVQVYMNKYRTITNNFDICTKQQKHIFKSRDTSSHGGIGREQRRKTVLSHAHNSPQ